MQEISVFIEISKYFRSHFKNVTKLNLFKLLMNAGEVLQLRIEKDESPTSKASSQTTEKPSLTTGNKSEKIFKWVCKTKKVSNSIINQVLYSLNKLRRKMGRMTKTPKRMKSPFLLLAVQVPIAGRILLHKFHTNPARPNIFYC